VILRIDYFRMVGNPEATFGHSVISRLVGEHAPVVGIVGRYR
jgi:hypothetical protein